MKNLLPIVAFALLLAFVHFRSEDHTSVVSVRASDAPATFKGEREKVVSLRSRKKLTVSKKVAHNTPVNESMAVEGFIELGDQEMVSRYLRAGGNIEETDEYGRSLLNQAAYYGNTDLVKFLVEEGADLFSVDNQGQSVLHHLTAHGKSETLEYLLNQPNVDVNVTDDLGQSPIHIAIQRGDQRLFDLLVAHGADAASPNHPGRYYMSPFHAAIVEGQQEMIEKMIKINPDLIFEADSQGRTSLMLATLEGYGEIVALLRDYGAVSEL